jgi:hypothetical protein
MKRVFGTVEIVFDLLYLTAAFILALVLLLYSSGNYVRTLAGVMALVLAGGDAFHLIPRILVIKTGREEPLRKALGTGRQVTSITMTLFYLLLWQIGVLVFSPKDISGWSYSIYALTTIRILLCLLPQNKWQERYPPVTWGILRNIPFFLQGALVGILYFLSRNTNSGLGPMWLAIALSFLFYLPVVLWANKNPRIGMLMLPKTCAYLWMLVICLSL